MKNLRAVVADDEPLARRKLQQFLADRNDVHCVGEAADGLKAVQLVDRLQPDVLFLDIRMPGVSGIEVIERIQSAPHVIFTTAYDKYAVTAFELQALDYLLKPFNSERFDQALSRVKQLLQSEKGEGFKARVRQAMPGAPVLSRLFVRKRGRIIPILVADVQLFEAGDEYVTVHVGSDRHLISVRMRDLEAQLDPNHFVRVHRSYMVNLNFVRALTPYDGARLQIELANGHSVVASRAQSKALRRLAV